MKNIKYELLSKYRNVNNFDGKSPLYIVTEDANEKVSHSILTEESLNHLSENKAKNLFLQVGDIATLNYK